MYKIMLADDEGIVIDSLRFIIEKNFGQSCEIQWAKTGRGVIELAEDYRPDIAIMDIHMPGINGIEAMKEIRKFNQKVLFIVMSAFDKFSYAKESIDLGVIEYLTKPANQNKIVEAIEKAIIRVDQEREKRSKDLDIKEKLETVIPIIESGFVYNILFHEDSEKDISSFKQLLNISSQYGFALVIEFGDKQEDGKLANPVGVSIKAQKFYSQFREIVGEFYPAVIGPIMANKIVLIIPYEKELIEYEECIRIIETTRNLIRKLSKRIDVHFKGGIGDVKELNNLQESYNEAIEVLRISNDKVGHVKDLPIRCQYDDVDYPVKLEKALFNSVNKADLAGAKGKATAYFDWMLEKHGDYPRDIKLKVIEFVLYAEYLGYSSGGMIYDFRARTDYLPQILEMTDYGELKEWFVGKIAEVCRKLLTKKEEQSNDIITKAKQYIMEKFNRDISLNEVSKVVDISPYYFSKLFKDETGENFIEYLTNIRIERSKQLLNAQELSIKEICLQVGYSDPNYFSRIFKKCVGVTPTEYREGVY